VRDFLVDQFGTHSCPLDTSFWSDVFHLVGRLGRLIPPNEIINPNGTVRIADICQILNAGWLYKLTQLPSMYTDSTLVYEYFDELTILNNLILKAVEMSDLQKDYQTYS
jgi:hypothetical protein